MNIEIDTCPCNGCSESSGPWHEFDCGLYTDEDWIDEDRKPYKYVYEDPTSKGMTRVYLTQKQHNELFPHRPRSWKLRYDYFLSEDRFEMHRMISVIGQVIITILFPVSFLMYGISNYKEIISDHKKALWQRTYGSFSTDVVYNNDRQRDLFDRIERTVRR